MKRFIIIPFSLLLFIVLLASAQSEKTNFSGTWILDASKSDMGDAGSGRGGRGMGFAPTKMVVTQEKNKLTVVSFRKNRNGEETSITANYTLDDKKCKNTIGDRTSVSTAEWSEDGKSLIIRSEMTFGRDDREFTMHSEANWSLEEGELVIETTRSTPMGERTTKAVYKLEKK